MGTELSSPCLIADPLDLWREKGRPHSGPVPFPQDSLHLEVLGTTLQWEMARYAEKVATGELPFDLWLSRVDSKKALERDLDNQN